MKTQMYMSQFIMNFSAFDIPHSIGKKAEIQNNFSYSLTLSLGITIVISILMVVIARVCLDILFLKIIQNILYIYVQQIWFLVYSVFGTIYQSF